MNKMIPTSKNSWNLYNMIDDFFGDNFAPTRSVQASSFKVDVKEEEKSYIVEAEMPGIEKENIDIQLHKGEMVINVTHKEENTEERANYIHRERRSTSMCRRLYLGDVDEDHVSAKLENGILTIDVPKKPAQIKKVIDID